MQDILKSRQFDVVDYVVRYRALAQHLKLDFSAIIFALENIPVCIRRPAHSQSRQAMARLIAGTNDELHVVISNAASGFDCLQKTGCYDLLNELVQPSVDAVLKCVIGFDLNLASYSSLPMVFSETIGIRKRKRLEVEMRTAIDQLKAAFPQDDAKQTGQRLALAILGRDALTGAISNSLHHMFIKNSGKRMSEIGFGAYLPRTGVPFVDRIAVEDSKIGADSFSAGDCHRVRLDSFESSAIDRDRIAFFGSGEHTCLGRAQSLELWKQIGTRLMQIERRIQVLSFDLKNDGVFRTPVTFEIEVL